MKTRILIAMAALSAAMLFSTVALQAQGPTPIMAKVDVPFAFVAGGMAMPAGRYNLFHIVNSNVILVRSSDLKAAAMVHVNWSLTGAKASANKLVFHRYGEKYFLAEVWTATDNERHDCLQSSAERELASSRAKTPVVATVYSRP